MPFSPDSRRARVQIIKMFVFSGTFTNRKASLHYAFSCHLVWSKEYRYLYLYWIITM